MPQMARRPFMKNTMEQPMKRVKGMGARGLRKADLAHQVISRPRLINIYVS
jgi:hypothetical protein